MLRTLSTLLFALTLAGAQTAPQQDIIDKLTTALLNLAKQTAEEARDAEHNRNWLKAAEAYEKIVGFVPDTAPPMTRFVLVGNAHLDAARCWTRYRESRQGYSPIEADQKVQAHLDAADQAYRLALASLDPIRGNVVLHVVPKAEVKALGAYADVKVNQAYLHVLQNNLDAAANDYRALLARYPGSAKEFAPALHRVEDAKTKQAGGVWTDDNKVALAAFLAGRTPEFGFVLKPLVTFGYQYYEAHSPGLPYRTQ